MNLFKCHRCKREFNGEGDKYFICPLCKRHAIIVNVPQYIFGKSVKEVRENINQFETMKRHELIKAHKDIHAIHKYQDVLDLHMVIIDEFEKRHIHHEVIDKLDKDTQTIRNKKLDEEKISNLLEDSIKQYDILYEALSKTEEPIISDNTLLEDTVKSFLRKRFILGKHLIAKEPKQEKKQREKATYEYAHAPVYTEEIINTDKLIIEPTIKKAKRILIIRNGLITKIHSSDKKEITKKSILDRVNGITSPQNFVAEGYLLSNGAIALTDLLEKDGESLVKDSTLSRKTDLLRMRINKSANIGILNFTITRTKDEIKKALNKYKLKKSSVTIKPCVSSRTGWLKVNFYTEETVVIITEKHLQEVLDAEDDTYKKIVVKDLLHKIENPYEILERLYDKLNNWGKLEIFVPHEDSIKNKELAKTLWNEQSILFFTNPYLIKKNETKCIFEFDPIEEQKARIVRRNGKVWKELHWTLRAIKKGGPGSGCQGPNCGRPSTGGSKSPISTKEGSALQEKLKTDGGFSYNVYDKTTPTTGYMVSPYKNFEKVIDGKVKTRDIIEYAKKNKSTLKKQGHHLGGWVDTETNKTFLDIAVHTNSKRQAIGIAKTAKQLAIYDIKGNKSIYLKKT